jgi:Ca2+-transporting ATPase
LNFLQGVLAVAAIVSTVIGEYIDAGVIFFLIALNIVGKSLWHPPLLRTLITSSTVGFMQEFRAERTLQKLRDLSAPTCTIIRDGHASEHPSEHIVPGDILVCRA